jgi:hypothetical protein
MRPYVLVTALAVAAAPALALNPVASTQPAEKADAGHEELRALPADWLDGSLDAPAADDKVAASSAAGGEPAANAAPAAAEPCERPDGTTGLILGAVAGGLLGRKIEQDRAACK